MLTGASQYYLPLSEDAHDISQLASRLGEDLNISEWEAFSSKMVIPKTQPKPKKHTPRTSTSSTTELPARKKSVASATSLASVPNLKAKFLEQRFASEELVISNLNKASDRLDDQRAVLPPREWFLPEFIPAIKPISPLHPTLILDVPSDTDDTGSLDELIDQFPTPRQEAFTTDFLAPHDYDEADEVERFVKLSSHLPSKPLHGVSLSSDVASGPGGNYRRPISQPELPSMRTESPHLRRVNELRHNATLSQMGRSKIDQLPSFVALLESSTERLDTQRADDTLAASTRPRSWGAPVPHGRPLSESQTNTSRRSSLKSAFARLRREGSSLFKKKNETNSDSVSHNESYALGSMPPHRQPTSPLKASFWTVKRRPNSSSSSRC